MRVQTAGVGSRVFGADRSLLGHVVLLDLDDVDAADALTVADAVDGPVVVSRSSTSSWHVVGLAVRPWGDALDLLREHSAPEHVDAAEQRGQATLRTHSKRDVETGEIATPPPVPVVVVDGDADQVSRPHLVRLQQAAAALDAPALDSLDALDAETGATLSTARYSYEVAP